MTANQLPKLKYQVQLAILKVMLCLKCDKSWIQLFNRFRFLNDVIAFGNIKHNPTLNLKRDLDFKWRHPAVYRSR